MDSRKKLLISALVVLGVLLAASASLFFYQRAYAERIYPNVFFGEINLSGKTRKQAEVILKSNFSKITNQEIKFVANTKEIKATYLDTGLSLDFIEIARQGYQVGREGNFVRNLFRSVKVVYSPYKISGVPYVDDVKFQKFVEVSINQLNSDPVDASIKVENGEIKLVESANGQKVKIDTLKDVLITNALAQAPDIVLETVPASPTISTLDYSAAKSSAEAYLAKTITFTYNDLSYSPTKTQIGHWLEFYSDNGAYKVRLNESNVKAYLINIAGNFEVKKVDKQVDALSGGVIREGKAGITLNKDQAVTDLKNQLINNKAIVAMAVTTQDPAEVKIYPAEGIIPGKFEGKYVDVNLSTQKLCQIETNTVVSCHTISSGKASMPTPEGTFHIGSKDPKRWSNTYGLWMPFWQEFKDGVYGLHELPEWPNGYKEGQDHLGIPVSHGCVRLGIGEAEQVFNWTEIGTPVYIHR
ncbi:MAG: L,D-transpeptidase family protein [Patescibacteria group bacterium]|jgi:lipoprotein-anchoring transpeptidase ErfK/SrfK